MLSLLYLVSLLVPCLPAETRSEGRYLVPCLPAEARSEGRYLVPCTLDLLFYS